MNTSRLAAACALLLGVLSGCRSTCHSWRSTCCGSSNSWQGTFHSDGEYARLDTDAVDLVFESVPLPLGQSSMTTTSSMRVSGSGTSKVRVSMKGKIMTSSYADGVNTINVEGLEVRIVDAGRKAQVGSRSFDLTGPKKTLVIHEDGTASVR